MRVILLIFLCSILSAPVYSQAMKVPVSEQPVYLVYAKAQRTDGKLKVLLISKYLIRHQDWSMPVLEIPLSLDFNDMWTSRVQRDESYFSGDYDNVTPYTIMIDDIHGGYLQWNYHTREYLSAVNSSDNTLQVMEKIRTALIEDHRQRGYKVYQVDFNPNLSGSNSSGYKYYDSKTATWLPYKLERLSPLSELYVARYRTGEIRDMLSRLSGQSVSGSGGGIVIESNGSQNNQQGSGSKPTKPSKPDNTDYKALALARQMEAGAYEAEGDRLNKLGTLFMMQALEQYKLAQKAYYTERVQQKINTINSYVAFGQAVNQGLDSLEAASERLRKTIDATGLKRFRAIGLNYAGLLPSYKNVSSVEGQNSYYASFTYGFYRILAAEMGFNYFQSPTYDFFLTDRNGYKNGQTIRANQAGVGFELSFGLAYPVKGVLLYALHGWHFPLGNVSAEMVSAQYQSDELKDAINPMLIHQKSRFGLKYRLPNSRIGFGLNYQLVYIDGDKLIDDQGPNNDVSRGTSKYLIGGSVYDKYRVGRLEVSILILEK